MFIILAYFVDVPAATQFSGTLMVWATIVMIFSLPLGAINIVTNYGKKIVQKKRNYGWSVMLLLFMGLTVYSGIILGSGSDLYIFILNGFYWPLGATFYSSLAFYMMSACFVALRFNSKRASVMVLAASFVILKTMPMAEVIPASSVIGTWLLEVQTVGVTRGVLIGATISTIALAVRTMLGYETSAIGVRKEAE